ncbi:MAG: TrkH family potassium uptake protein [Bacteroidales bacterium]|jgi:trk system potassium uptake protein TrkH|nr:TrkH family potassium uptake protein [Bacteroidales bacterium]
MNVRFILHVLGTLLAAEGILMLLPAAVSLMYGEGDAVSILAAALTTLATGASFRFFFKSGSREIGKREGHVIVSAVWIVFTVFGSLPFIFSGQIPSVSDAFFETMSGFTTTGSTILTDIERLSHGMLFWRSLMHFTGGLGILVMAIAILPVFGVGSMSIYQAETSSAIAGNRLSPKIKDTARHITRIYLFFNVACMLFYLPEMGVFDALCHAFSTTASGGFSTKNASMGTYSAYSQYVSVAFMLLAGTNFTLLFYAWKRDFRKLTSNDEFRYYLSIVLVASLFICCWLLFDGAGTERSVRESLFHTVSILTTTGYVVSDYTLWTPPLWFVLYLISFVGGCAGSTSGGLKVVRFVLLSRAIPVQFKRILHQRGMIQVKLNGQNVSDDQLFRTLSFFMIFLCIFTVGALVLMICGLDFVSAVGAAIACLSNSGPGLGMVGPAGSFAEISAVGKWVCSFMMLLGRLELYAVLILCSRNFWKSEG